MITLGASIPEILKTLSRSFSETEIYEVQELLTGRERMLIIEISDLKRDLGSMRNELRLQERSYDAVEMEKLRIVEKLHKSERRCEELNEEIARLSEEHNASCERAKGAEESCETLSKEFSKMITEKVQLILELNGKITELQSKNLENERLVVEYKDQVEFLVPKVVNLKAQKLAPDQVGADLKGQKCEASRSLDEWSHEKLENLAPEVKIIETKLANMLNVKVGDLASLSDFMDRSFPKGKRVDFPGYIKRWKHANTEDTASDDTPLVTKGLHDSVRSAAGGASKVPVSSSAAKEVIEICDSDDESKPGTLDSSSGQNKKKRRVEICTTNRAGGYWFPSDSDSDSDSQPSF